jgi:UDP-glucose 4-epimerase
VTVLDSFAGGRRDSITHLNVDVVEGDVRDESVLSELPSEAGEIFYYATQITNINSIENSFEDSDVDVNITLLL